jgi:hypothetical protein
LREIGAPGHPADVRRHWHDRFRAVRSETEARAARLSPEDQIVQSMADASPTKWHRAHVTWFFETFLLVPHAPDYHIFDERFPFLFNSYYVAAGPRHARPERGLITRPNAQDVTAYRAHVDEAVARLIGNAGETLARQIVPVLEIGLHHEQQHQELLLRYPARVCANPTHRFTTRLVGRRPGGRDLCRHPARYSPDARRRGLFRLPLCARSMRIN